MSLRAKIISGFSVILLLMVIMSGYSLYNVIQINKNVELVVQEDLPKLSLSNELAHNMAERLALVRGYILLGKKEYKEGYIELTERSYVLEEELLTLHEDTYILNLVEKSQLWDRLITGRIFPMFEANGRETAIVSIQYQVDPLANEVVEGYHQLAINGQAQIINQGTQVSNSTDTVVMFNIVATAIGIVIAVVVALITARQIVSPITSVVRIVEQVAKGDLTGKSIEVKTNDELGKLTASTNEMANNLRSLVSRTTETANQVAAASEELTASSQQTTVATNQIASTISDVAKGAEVTVTGAQESARAMEEMTIGIQRIAESSSVVAESSLDATQEAQEGNKSLERVIEQMNSISNAVKDATVIIGRLGERSNEIGSILGVITTIADQTNLLALNAAIEAARAGEHGKGFAVVADEVRKLAEESRQSAAKISSVIHEIQADTSVAVKTMDNGTKEVEAGIVVVGETGYAFERILAAIQNVSSQIQEVSATAEQISASSQQVSASVDEMANVAGETAEHFRSVAAGSEQQLSSMEEIQSSATNLSKLAQELQDEINKFKI
ncbi:methyl-accepting chemotaxis protein [Anaerobacillus alkaliphilus]|uniref:Methyl-accepting chemotaxis protein n=1 Tax=Anaerobacillus alkaliphilus TaxID=1548597 RepID=A0A4Q0VPL6_9BACI|nr:methyl-accepting chemotaxis protein [Anaerobacillus alkaliphilus]RXI97855.1 methyl-accepting chemotaxis protein [Anaerobacillus alkaliphilus]